MMRIAMLLLSALAACYWFGCAAGLISYEPWVAVVAFAMLGVSSLLDFVKNAILLSARGADAT